MLDNYDPSTALSAYYPTRDERRPARLWATEKLLHDMAELGMVEFFEGPGTDPTVLSGYDSAKAWLQVSSGITAQPGKVRIYDGIGDSSDVANWPEMTAGTFVGMLGAVPVIGGTMTGLLNIRAGNATTVAEYLKLLPSDWGAGKPSFSILKDATSDVWRVGLWDGVDTDGTINISAGAFTHNNSAVLVAADIGATVQAHGVSVLKSGDTMSGALVIAAGNATTAKEFLRLAPTDYGTGKPYLAFSKSATADRWDISIWDGSSIDGTIGLAGGRFDIVSPRTTLTPPYPTSDENYATLSITHHDQRPISHGIVDPDLGAIPGSVGKSAISINTTRSGGEGAYGNILMLHKVTKAIAEYEFDSGVTAWSTAKNLDGGQIFGAWFGANSPASYLSGDGHNVNMTPGATGVVGTEINGGNRWGDPGWQDEPADGQADWFVTVLNVAPDVVPVNGEDRPEYPTHLYPASFGVNLTRSVWGHRFWVGMTVPIDSIMPGGVAFNVAGGQTNATEPAIAMRLRSYWECGLDFRSAVFSDACFHFGNSDYAATASTPGAGHTLPGTAWGYIKAMINGNAIRIPYFPA